LFSNFIRFCFADLERYLKNDPNADDKYEKRRGGGRRGGRNRGEHDDADEYMAPTKQSTLFDYIGDSLPQQTSASTFVQNTQRRIGNEQQYEYNRRGGGSG
jgi:hypothetical protein